MSSLREAARPSAAGEGTEPGVAGRPAQRAIEMPLAGWGNFRPSVTRLYRPDRIAEARRLVLDPQVPSLIARGLGRAYGDSAVDDRGGTVLSQRLDRFRAFDPATGVVTCEAGLSLESLIRTFLPRGYFLPVSPGTKFVTVGGAVAADIHGKNHHRDGSFSSFVDELELLTASGETVVCSRRDRPELFRATIGGMGLTGFILSATIRLKKVESSYLVVDYHKSADLDEAFQLFQEGDGAYEYSVAWIDCLARGKSLGRSVLMRGNHAGPGDLMGRARDEPLTVARPGRKSVPIDFPGFALNRLSVGAFNNLYYARQKNQRKIVLYEPFFYPLDAVSRWNRIYGRRGFVQYQALFPSESSHRGMVQLLEAISAAGMASFLSVLKSTGPFGEGMLSYTKAGHTLALDLPNKGRRLTELTAKLDRILLDNGGRLYLAKDSLMDRATFDAMYPNSDAFRELKAQIDPRGRFASAQARRVGLVEGPRS